MAVAETTPGCPHRLAVLPAVVPKAAADSSPATGLPVADKKVAAGRITVPKGAIPRLKAAETASSRSPGPTTGKVAVDKARVEADNRVEADKKKGPSRPVLLLPTAEEITIIKIKGRAIPPSNKLKKFLWQRLSRKIQPLLFLRAL